MKFVASSFLLSVLALCGVSTACETPQCNPNDIYKQCPNYDFTWHAKNSNMPVADISVTSVSYVQSNVYDVNIHFECQDNMDINALDELKIIGLATTSGSSVILYSRNMQVYTISNPKTWDASVQVYADASGSDACMPTFEIQFDWCSLNYNNAQSQCNSWKYGKSYDYITGCNNADNQGHSQTDASNYCWPLHCGPEEKSSTTSIVHPLTTSSKTTSTHSTHSSTTPSTTTSSSSDLTTSSTSSTPYPTSHKSETESTTETSFATSSSSTESSTSSPTSHKSETESTTETSSATSSSSTDLSTSSTSSPTSHKSETESTTKTNPETSSSSTDLSTLSTSSVFSPTSQESETESTTETTTLSTLATTASSKIDVNNTSTVSSQNGYQASSTDYTVAPSIIPTGGNSASALTPSQVSTTYVSQSNDTVTVEETIFTTYCDEPTTFTWGGETYTVTRPTTLTITSCPDEGCEVEDSTVTVDQTVFTTYCDEPMTLTWGGKTYTVTRPTTLTITSCPDEGCEKEDVTTTLETTIFTTYCPEPTTFTWGGSTYTITEPTTLTITTCPVETSQITPPIEAPVDTIVTGTEETTITIPKSTNPGNSTSTDVTVQPIPTASTEVPPVVNQAGRTGENVVLGALALGLSFFI